MVKPRTLLLSLVKLCTDATQGHFPRLGAVQRRLPAQNTPPASLQAAHGLCILLIVRSFLSFNSLVLCMIILLYLVTELWHLGEISAGTPTCATSAGLSPTTLSWNSLRLDVCSCLHSHGMSGSVPRTVNIGRNKAFADFKVRRMWRGTKLHYTSTLPLAKQPK